jgi:hypothetical protein
VTGQSGQPTVVTSRRRQHELLRSWSGWPLTSILIDPAEVAHARESGWADTHHHDQETGLRIVGSAEGLGFGVDEGWHHPSEVIAWPEVEAIAAAVPAEVRRQLVEFRARWRDHQVAYPRFVASADAVGCGPIVPGQPLTASQEAYVREHVAFEASGVLPAWEQQRAVLDAERLSLHAQALTLDADSEAGDLLELLADQQVGKAAAAPTGAEIRACVEDEYGHVTSTDVADAKAQFFTVYELDDDGLPQAVSDHPTRESAHRALEDRQVVEADATGDLTEDQVRERVSRLRRGKPAWINGVQVQKTGTYGRDRRPVFLIGDPIAGGPYVSVISDKIVPSELRRHHNEMAEYSELPEAGKAAYDEARLSREAIYHHEAMRAALEAAPPPAEQPSPTGRPALRPPVPNSTSRTADAVASSSAIAPYAGGVDR